MGVYARDEPYYGDYESLGGDDMTHITQQVPEGIDPRAIARGLGWIEEGIPQGQHLLKSLFGRAIPFLCTIVAAKAWISHRVHRPILFMKGNRADNQCPSRQIWGESVKHCGGRMA